LRPYVTLGAVTVTPHRGRIAASAIVGVIVAGSLAWHFLRPEPDPGPSIATVLPTCPIAARYGQVLDGGTAVHLVGYPQPGGNHASVQDVTCVLERLGAPGSVMVAIGQTSALDGRQSESWPGWTVSWAYSPAAGLDVLVRKAG
jgi:hypothetical protein